VVRTRVGYTGGSTPDPFYESLGDHTESVEVEYDPSQISYQDLLDVFWASHTPTYKPTTRQYMPAVFYHNPEQQRLAEQSKARQAAQEQGPIYTQILRATQFYPAEDYHQKYWLRHQLDFMYEFRAMYPEDADIVASTAAARVNGYVAGYGTREALLAEIDSLGLSADAQQRLLDMVRPAKD
jgi:peptide-methionine (S)-S-oxide reductase